jgi:hypothetical protein
VQANVTQIVGAISVAGSVTVGSRTATDNSAKDKRQFAQGYLDVYQMRCSNIRLDENGLIERFEVAWRPLASVALIQEKRANKFGGQPMRLVPV